MESTGLPAELALSTHPASYLIDNQMFFIIII